MLQSSFSPPSFPQFLVMEEKERLWVWTLLTTKLPPEDFEEFDDDNIEKLDSYGFINASTFEAATESLSMQLFLGNLA